jgi:predicted O-linked N-acetylglucosamine transferase (SPINDLY family)
LKRLDEALAAYERAVKLKPSAVEQLRYVKSYARNRKTHPLFDTKRFARHIEAVYTTMWERYQRGEAPKAFVVNRME